MTTPAQHVLCRVEPGLVDHVRQLLSDAGLSSQTRPSPDGHIDVTVAADDEEHARAVIGIVLPQLLTQRPDPATPGGLSDRLIRSEDPDSGLPGGLIDGRATFGYADPLADRPDDAADFVPPVPPPLPRPRDRLARASWFAVLGGPILLILTVVFNLPGILKTAGLILFFGGFATLVYRMEDRRRHEDGWDDGAVV